VHTPNGSLKSACTGYQRFIELLREEVQPARRGLSAWDLLFGAMPLPEGFDPERDLDPGHLRFWHRSVTLPAWLERHGYADALAALEAGETGPEGLVDLLREQAGYDQKDRAWDRIEKALNGDEPAEIQSAIYEALDQPTLPKQNLFW
jgi:hypothetical protein